MTDNNFNGDKKLPMHSPLARMERQFIDSNVHRFPRWLEGYHLTMMTALWSIGLLLFAWLADKTGNYHWLHLSSLVLFLQWFTDSFDGALGRTRDTGIPKWGFYMDHFLDFVFMSCVVIGYSFLLEGIPKELMLYMVPLMGCLMVNSFLGFGATSEFKITYLGTGPTELRIYFIVLNIAISIFGITFLENAIPYALAVTTILITIIVYRTQKYIWKVDMEEKKARDKTNNHAA